MFRLKPELLGLFPKSCNFGPSSTLIGFQPTIHAGGTTVAFVDGTSATDTVNLGIEQPAEYCQNNPQLATSCYIKGDQKLKQCVVVK